MHLHILGIGGTLMGSIAALAQAVGHKVSGSEPHLYPPMSQQLQALGIPVHPSYDPAPLDPVPDCVVIGNALARGNPAVEWTLNEGLAYTSGPAWLASQILADRWVIAVAGTHGKTTTAAMVAWILEAAGWAPGFLIGGVPRNFATSARLGASRFFVIEADEYDSAFFDKRSKFIHYRPRTAVLNNLEFDHADIFTDLADIERQFHHFVRTIPGRGLIIANGRSEPISRVLSQGCWTPVQRFGVPEGWEATLPSPGRELELSFQGQPLGRAHWHLLGRHNRLNALAAIAAARHAGIAPGEALAALERFQGVRRRLEVRAVTRGITLYDDFAHHPTAIASTLEGLRTAIGKARLIAVLEPRSNTMRLGHHRDRLPSSLQAADRVFLYQPPGLSWEVTEIAEAMGDRTRVSDSIAALAEAVAKEAREGDHIVTMSNGSFGDLIERLQAALRPSG